MPPSTAEGKCGGNPNSPAAEQSRLSDGFEARRNFGSRGTILRRLAEHCTQQAVEFLRNAFGLGRQRRRFHSLDQPRRGAGRLATERIRSRCQFVQDNAEGEDIARGRNGPL